jgi:hypothetical protein
MDHEGDGVVRLAGLTMRVVAQLQSMNEVPIGGSCNRGTVGTDERKPSVSDNICRFCPRPHRRQTPSRASSLADEQAAQWPSARTKTPINDQTAKTSIVKLRARGVQDRTRRVRAMTTTVSWSIFLGKDSSREGLELMRAS